MPLSISNSMSLLLTMNYFSRLYFLGVVCGILWATVKFVRALISPRRSSSRSFSVVNDQSASFQATYAEIASIQSFTMVLTSGCFVNQIFGVWFTYMARVTDANPFFALQDAWAIAQILVFLHVALDAMRRYAYVKTMRQQTEDAA